MGVVVSDAALTTYRSGLTAGQRLIFNNAFQSVYMDTTVINSIADVLEPNTSKLTFYLTTNAATQSTDQCTLSPPYLTNPACGIKIAQPLVILANTAGKFITRVVNPASAFDNSTAGECNLQDISFSFE